MVVTAGPNAETRAVAWRRDLRPLDTAAGQLPTVVSADVLNRVLLTIEIKYHDLRAIDADALQMYGREFACRCYSDPIRHWKPNDE